MLVRLLASPSDMMTSLLGQNAVLLLIIDVMLGLLIFNYVSSKCSAHMLGSMFIQLTEYIVLQLDGVITWLMGVPAGLKLNAPLATSCGHFFLYHIYLWKTYITLVTPLLTHLISLSLILSCGGITLLLATISDFLFLATLHVYCFYVYATRLYRLFSSGLGFLWRLFRGKKWNPLRGRVDSYMYDVNQLIAGMIGFTILLFLFPTVVMYYCVFAVLWLMIVIVKSVMASVVRAFNTNPLYICLMWVFNTSTVAGELVIKTDMRVTEDGSLLLKVGSSRVSLQKTIQCALLNKIPKQKQENGHNVPSLISTLIHGRLINAM